MSLARFTNTSGKSLLDLPTSNQLTQIHYLFTEGTNVWLEPLSEDSMYLSDIREAVYYVAIDLMYQLGV
jgi:hypothetical protein